MDCHTMETFMVSHVSIHTIVIFKKNIERYFRKKGSNVNE